MELLQGHKLLHFHPVHGGCLRKIFPALCIEKVTNDWYLYGTHFNNTRLRRSRGGGAHVGKWLQVVGVARIQSGMRGFSLRDGVVARITNRGLCIVATPISWASAL